MGTARKISRPAGENAGLRDDAQGLGTAGFSMRREERKAWQRLRSRHLLRSHHLIKLFAGEVSQFQRRLSQTSVIYMGGMSDLCRLVVSNFGRQSRNQHQRILDVPIHL